jgi:hypothetical protein
MIEKQATSYPKSVDKDEVSLLQKPAYFFFQLDYSLRTFPLDNHLISKCNASDLPAFPCTILQKARV